MSVSLRPVCYLSLDNLYSERKRVGSI